MPIAQKPLVRLVSAIAVTSPALGLGTVCAAGLAASGLLRELTFRIGESDPELLAALAAENRTMVLTLAAICAASTPSIAAGAILFMRRSR